VYSDEAMATPYSRARVFLAMSREGQLKFIAERLKQVDTAELVNLVSAIFGHPHDRGRPRKSTSGQEPES